MNKKTITLIFVMISLVSLAVSNVSAAGCCLNTAQRSHYCHEVDSIYCCPAGSPADCSTNYFFTGSDCTDKNDCIGDNVGCCCDDEGSSSPRDPDYEALCTDEGWTFNFPYPLFQTCSEFCGGLPSPTDDCVGLSIDDCQNDALGGGPCRWTYTNFDQDPDEGECNTGCKDNNYLESRGNVYCYPKCEVGKQIRDVGKTCVCTASDFEKSKTDSGYCCASGYQLTPCSAVPTEPLKITKAQASPSSGDAPLTVTFAAEATDGTPPYSYSWRFGDGAIGSGVTTSHTYTTVGTYIITLRVGDNSIPKQEVDKSISITVTEPVECTDRKDINCGEQCDCEAGCVCPGECYEDGNPRNIADGRSCPTITITPFSLSPSTDTINVGETTQLTAQNAPGDVTWSTSDNSIATVSSNGLVTGKGEGTATITAISDGQTATAEITVKLEEDWIIISGVVKDALDHTVLEGIMVTADNAETETTNEKGEYTIQVPIDTIYLSFYDPGKQYLPTRYYISTGSSSPNPITGSVVESISDANAFMKKAECITPLAEDDSEEKKYAPKITVTRSLKPKKLTIKLVAPELETNTEIPMSYRIYRCNNDACTESSEWYLIHEIQQGDLTYIDTEAVYGELYTYAASAVYGTLESSLAIATVLEDDSKITLGDIECKDKTKADIGVYFCYNNIPVYCNKNFKLEKGGACKDGEVCINNKCEPREEKCKEALFGIYYSEDLNENTFFDVSKTIVDTCYECKKITHCNDYKSETACQDDKCSVGGDEYGHGENCKWEPINEELGIGVCINEKTNNCKFCSERNTEAPNEPAYNEIFQKCTEVKAGKLSTETDECFFINEEESKAKSCEEMSCYDYGTKSGTEACGTTTAFIDPLTNEITPKSDDKCGIGMCRFYSGDCVKITDRAIYLAAVVYRDSCNELEGEAKKNCEKDRTPPKTIVGTSYNFYEGLINKDASFYFTVIDDSDLVKTYFCIDHIKDNVGDKSVRENTCDPHPNKDGCSVDLTNNKFGEKTGLYLGKTVCGQKTSYLTDLNKITEGHNTIRFYSKDRANNLEVVKTFYFEISDPALELEGEGCDKKNTETCFRDTVTSRYDETDEKYKSTVTIEFNTNNYAKCEYWTSITTVADLKHQQDKDEICFSKEHTATFEDIEGEAVEFYFEIYCDNGLESKKIPFGPYMIYIGANKAIVNVKPSGKIPSKDNLLLEFETLNEVECKWRKHEEGDSILSEQINDYNHLKSLYSSIPDNQKFTAQEKTGTEGKVWHHTFTDLSAVVVDDGKYIFDIVCDNEILKDAFGKIEFTLDTTAPEKINAKISEGQPRAGENFNFEAAHTPQSIKLKCIDPPTKQEDTNIISIGYGCSVGYCTLRDDKIINGDGVVDGNECEPSKPDLTEGNKDIVVTEEISETSKICYKALENLPEGVEPRGEQRECYSVRIADKPSIPVYEIEELTQLPAGILEGYTKLGKKDEISYTEEDRTTTYIKLSEGYYKLKITAENLREKPKLYLKEYEEHEITIPDNDFTANTLNLDLYLHIFEYQVNNEKRLGLNIFETTEEIQNYRLKDYDGEADVTYKKNGVEDVTFKLVAYDLTEGHDPTDTKNPDSEGNYIEVYANYDIDNKPPEKAAITSILKSEDEETRIEITDTDEIYRLVIKDEKVTVEGSVSEDSHIVKLYKSVDDVYQSTDTLIGQPFEVEDNTFEISIKAAEFNNGGNYLFAFVEDSVGNWKLSEEKVIVYKTLNPITASLTVANQDWEKGIMVGQSEEADKIVPLSVRIEANAGLDKTLDTFKIKICHDSICEEPNEDGWLTEPPELKENTDGSYTADYKLVTNLQSNDNTIDYTLTVYVKDNSGNKITKDWLFTVNPQLPTLQDWIISENDGKFNVNDKKIYARVEKPTITVNFGTTNKDTKITNVKIYEKDSASVTKLDKPLEEYDFYEIKPDSELEDGKTYVIEVKAQKKLNTGYGSEGSYNINLVTDTTYPDVKDLWFKLRCISGITSINHIPDCDSGFEYLLHGKYNEINLDKIKRIIDSDERSPLTGLETQPFVFEPIRENLFDSGTEIKFIIEDKAGNKKEILLNQIKKDTTDLTFSGFNNNMLYTKNTPIFIKGKGVANKKLKIKDYSGLEKGSKEIDILGEFSIETIIEQNSDNNLIAYLFKDDELYFRKINIVHDNQPPKEIDRYPKTITPETKPKIYIKLEDFSGIDNSNIKFYLAETGISLKETDLRCSGSACVNKLADGTYEVSYTPTTDLTFGQSYTAKIEGIKDLAGNSLNPIEWSFTIDNSAPILKTAKLIRGTDEILLFTDGEDKGVLTNQNGDEIELVYESEVSVLIETKEGAKDSIILTGPTSLITTKRIYEKDGNKITFEYSDIGTLSDGAYTLKVKARKDIMGSSWDEKNIMFTIDTQPPQANDLIINVDGVKVSTTDKPKKQFTATTHQITVSAKDYSLGEGTNIICNNIEASGTLGDKDGKKQWSTNLDLSTLKHGTSVNCILDIYDTAGNHDETPLDGLFKIDSEGPEFTVEIKNVDDTDVPSAGDFLNPQKKKIGYGHYHLTIQSDEELKAPPKFKLNGVDVAVIDTGSGTGPWNFYMQILERESTNYFIIIQQNADWSSSMEGAAESRGIVTDGSDLDISVSGWDKALTDGNQKEKTNNYYKVDLTPPLLPTIDWIQITGSASRVDIPSKYLYIKDQNVDLGATLNDLEDIAAIKLYVTNDATWVIRDNIRKPSSGGSISLTDISNEVFTVGKNYLFIEVSDAVGNKAQSEKVVVLKDTKEPSITIKAPKDGVVVSSGDELKLDITIIDVNEENLPAAGVDEGSICVRVKDTNNYYGERDDSNNCLTGPIFADNKLSHEFFDLADLGEGTYTLTIEASDNSGNIVYSEITFEINKELPDNPSIEINGNGFDEPNKNVDNEYLINTNIQELELSFNTDVEFTNLNINDETIPLDEDSIMDPVELSDGREIEIEVRNSRITIWDIDPPFTDTTSFEITAAKSFETGGYGPEATWLITVIVDKIGPEIEIYTEDIEPLHIKDGTNYITVSSEIPVTITDDILLETCQYNVGNGWQDVSCSDLEYIDFIVTNIQSSATQIKIMATDIAGNEVTETIDVVIDSTPPQTIGIIKGEALNRWYNSDVNVALSCYDSGSGCAKIYCCLDQDNICEPFEDDECGSTISRADIDVYEDGINYLKYYSVDNLGNKEELRGRIVKIDQIPPEPTEWKPAADDVVKNRRKSITVTSNDDGSGIQCTGDNAPNLIVNGMERPITGCYEDGKKQITLTFEPSFDWIEGEGIVTVTINELTVYDVTGNMYSLPSPFEFTINTNNPLIELGTTRIENGDSVNVDTDIIFVLFDFIPDDYSKPGSVTLAVVKDGRDISSEFSLDPVNPVQDFSGDGKKYKFIKNSGNLQSGFYKLSGHLTKYNEPVDWGPITFVMDNTAPTNAYISINDGASHTTNPESTLTLSAEDALSEIGDVAVIQKDSQPTQDEWDEIYWVDYTDYDSILNPYYLSGFDGEKTVYAKFKDGAGLESDDVSDSIILDTIPPTLIKGDTIPTENTPTNAEEITANWIADSEDIAEYYYIFTEKGITENDIDADGKIKEATTIKDITTTSITYDISYLVPSGEVKTIYLFIQAKDNAGNFGDTIQYTFNIDRKLPIATDWSPIGTISDDKPEISVKVDGTGSDIECDSIEINVGTDPVVVDGEVEAEYSDDWSFSCADSTKNLKILTLTRETTLLGIGETKREVTTRILTVSDEAGNSLVNKGHTFTVDINKPKNPTITLNKDTEELLPYTEKQPPGLSYDNYYYTNEDVSSVVSAFSPDTEITSVTLSVDGETNNLAISPSNIFTYTAETYLQEGMYTFTINAKKDLGDGSYGEEYPWKIIIIVDKTKPVVNEPEDILKLADDKSTEDESDDEYTSIKPHLITNSRKIEVVGTIDEDYLKDIKFEGLGVRNTISVENQAIYYSGIFELTAETGQKEVIIRAYDKAGNIGEEQVTINYQTGGPSLTDLEIDLDGVETKRDFEAIAEKTYYTKSSTVLIKGESVDLQNTDEHPIISVKNKDKESTVNPIWEGDIFTIIINIETNNNIRVVSTNLAGNPTTSDPISIYRDSLTPSIKLVEPATSATSSTTPTLVFTTKQGIEDEEAKCSLSYTTWDGTSHIDKENSYSSQHTYTIKEPGLVKGTEYSEIKYLDITCEDKAGNSILQRIDIKVDNTKPEIISVTMLNGFEKSAQEPYNKRFIFYSTRNTVITLETNEETRCKYSIDKQEEFNNMVGFVYIDENEYKTTSFTSNKAEEIITIEGDSKTIYVDCIDKAQNNLEKVFIIAAEVDLNAPVNIITKKPEGATNDETPTIKVVTDVSSSCKIDSISPDKPSGVGDKFRNKAMEQDGVNAEGYPIYIFNADWGGTKLDISGTVTYTVSITCDDIPDTGRAKATSTTSFTIDKTPPEKPIITSPPTGTTLGSTPVRITTKVLEDNLAVKIYNQGYEVNARDTTLISDKTDVFEVTDFALSPGPNVIVARAYDQAGNPSEESDPVTIAYIAEVPAYSYIIPENKDVLNNIDAIEIGWAKDEPIDTVSIVVTRIGDLEGNSLSDNIEISRARKDNVFTFTPTEEITNGVYSIAVTATDTFEHITTFPTITFTVDDRIPIIEANIITSLTEDRRTNQKKITIDITVDGNGYVVSGLFVNDKYESTTGEVILDVRGHMVDLDKEGSNEIVIKASNERGTARNTLQPVIRDTTGAQASIIIED